MPSKKNIFERINDNVVIKMIALVFTLLGGVAFTVDILDEQKPKLQFEIITNSNVFDINAEVTRLDVILDSSSLKANNENLRIITIRVLNKGGQDIKIDMYDDTDPVGLKINNGTIIEKPEVIEFSNEYLKRKPIINKYNSHALTFGTFIIESSESFTLKILVLHKSSVVPSFEAIGKIAGQKSIAIVDVQEPTKPNAIATAFTGNFWVQLMRVIGYTIIGLVLLFAYFSGEERTKLWLKRRKREKIADEFTEKVTDYTYNKMDDALFERFISRGLVSLLEYSYYTEESRLGVLQKFREANKRSYYLGEPKKNRFDPSFQGDEIFSSLVEDGLIMVNDDNTFSVNKTMRKTLEHFISYVKNYNGYRDREAENFIERHQMGSTPQQKK